MWIRMKQSTMQEHRYHWTIVKTLVTYTNALSSQEEQVPIELNKLKEYVKQSILLLGQATNLITYHRRYNILSPLNCAPQQSKEMLREEADLLQQQDKNLFCKKFREHLISSAK